jgi:hypothetical protein
MLLYAAVRKKLGAKESGAKEIGGRHSVVVTWG